MEAANISNPDAPHIIRPQRSMQNLDHLDNVRPTFKSSQPVQHIQPPQPSQSIKPTQSAPSMQIVPKSVSMSSPEDIDQIVDLVGSDQPKQKRLKLPKFGFLKSGNDGIEKSLTIKGKKIPRETLYLFIGIIFVAGILWYIGRREKKRSKSVKEHKDEDV